MKVIKRVILAAAISAVAVWVWVAAMIWRNNADDQAFYQQHVAPALQSGSTFPTKEIAETLRRFEIRNKYSQIKFNAGIGFYLCCIAWIGCSAFERYRDQKRWEDVNRPAHPQAGKWANELLASGNEFVATDNKHRRVEINPVSKFVTLYRCNRVTAITDRKVEERIDLPFADILIASFKPDRGGLAIVLRTLQGRFLIRRGVEPYDTLAKILLDIAEFNRTQPECYKAARAAEPILRIPWFGWLMLVSTITVIAVLIWIMF